MDRGRRWEFGVSGHLGPDTPGALGTLGTILLAQVRGIPPGKPSAKPTPTPCSSWPLLAARIGASLIQRPRFGTRCPKSPFLPGIVFDLVTLADRFRLFLLPWVLNYSASIFRFSLFFPFLSPFPLTTAGTLTPSFHPITIMSLSSSHFPV